VNYQKKEKGVLLWNTMYIHSSQVTEGQGVEAKVKAKTTIVCHWAVIKVEASPWNENPIPATVITMLTYAASAWRGLIKASDRERIDSLINLARSYRYCAPDLPSFDELCDAADEELFSKAKRLSNHVLHALLPPFPLHHNVTICEKEHTHSSNLNILLTFQTVILSHTCCIKILIRPT